MLQQRAVSDDYRHEVGSRVKDILPLFLFIYCCILFVILKDLVDARQ